LRRRPPCAPLFPYTTLFRAMRVGVDYRSGMQRTDLARDRHLPLKPAKEGGVVGELGPDDLDRDQLARERLSEIDVAHAAAAQPRSEEHTSELQSRENLVCRL